MDKITEVEFQDKVLQCVDCLQDFVFEAGEQRYFYSKGLVEPKRCPTCREWRKRTLPNGGVRLNEEPKNAKG